VTISAGQLAQRGRIIAEPPQAPTDQPVRPEIGSDDAKRRELVVVRDVNLVTGIIRVQAVGYSERPPKVIKGTPFGPVFELATVGEPFDAYPMPGRTTAEYDISDAVLPEKNPDGTPTVFDDFVYVRAATLDGGTWYVENLMHFTSAPGTYDTALNDVKTINP